MSKNNKHCWHLGCKEYGIKCIGLQADEAEFYCSGHAIEHGFCAGCGIYSAGVESFSFGDFPGLCSNCADHLKAELNWEENYAYEDWTGGNDWENCQEHGFYDEVPE